MHGQKTAPKPLWAQLRDTHGEDLPSTEPLSTLIAAHPHLRGLTTSELAQELQVSEVRAERAIDGYVRDAVPAQLVPRGPAAAGQSVDVRFALAGRAAAPGWVTSRGGRSFVSEGARETSGWNDSPSGQAPLPLGFFYTMPNRCVTDEKGTIVRADAPTDFDALQATILRGPIESDPSDPAMPHPNLVRAFVFAIRGSGAGMVTNMNGELAAHPGGILTNGADPSTILASYAASAREGAPGWPAPLPGEGWNRDAIAKAFDAFKWYGALPGDLETPEGVTYFDGWSSGDRVSRERYVYWYQIDDDGNWNRCQQVQGYSDETKEWILPTKWGEKLRAWMWRPTDASDPHNVGEWRTFFSFDSWINENKGTIAIVAFWVASIAISVTTLGAGSATIVAAASLTAILVAAQRLYVALMSDDPGKAVAAVVELGKALNNAAGEGGLAAAIKKNNPGLATFGETVAAPFQKIYEAAGGAIGDVYGLWAKAQAMKNNLPVMGQVAWGAALSAFGGTKGPGAWLQMARLPTTGEIGAELWANAPQWAKDVVALGLALSALEQAQKGQTVMFSQAPTQSVKLMGQGFIQLPKFTQEAVQSIWKPPPPPIVPTVPKFVASPGSGPKAAAGGGAVVAVAAAGAIAWFFFLR